MAKYINPYVSSKSSDNMGTQHGAGMPTKIGKKKGTFIEDSPKYEKAPKAKAPRKMN